MRKDLNFMIVFMLLFLSLSAFAQKDDFTGFWRVENVLVGDENMTPVSKWFRINPDGSYQTGNGWLQNGQGHWDYNAEENIFTATDPLDVSDEFGGFTVSFDNGRMFWDREEEGVPVRVTLVPIEKLPMSPADYLKGMWDLVEVTENEQSIIEAFDGENKHKLFIRWDRIYINFNPEGKRLTGYWFIHAHKPEITLLPHQEGEEPVSWKIEVNEKELIMTGISDSNRTIKRKYQRRDTF